MSEITTLGNLYGRLCGELAAALARRVSKLQYRSDWTVIENVVKPGLKGAAIYHDSMSAFEASTVALTSYGLLVPVPRDDKPGETWFCLHALTMDADAMPDHLASSVRDGDDRLPNLLEAFLRVFCGYDSLSDRHSFFTPPDYLTAPMSMLARTGYAEKAGDQFRWAAKIGPAMQAAYVWDEHLVSFSERDEIDVETNARLAWQTMPDALKQAIRSRKVSVLEVTKILALGWRDSQWYTFRFDDPATLRDTDLPMARRLFEIAEAERL